MSDKRKKIAAFCLKTEANNCKVEIFKACDWPDGDAGFVRLRIDGKWMDGPKGQHQYLNADAVASVVLRLLCDSNIMPPAPPKPQFALGQVVFLEGPPFDAEGFGWGTQSARVLCAEPILAQDLRWYVAVSCIGRGCRIVPADTLQIA